ncbi:MAG TPA: tetratricopeptide repeat protein [Planctomycetota bacterium]|nr:tetratricopeptide repeat protein [Planctomycetota bacterium]
MTDGLNCGLVDRYLDRFLNKEGRDAASLEAVSAHVGACPACYERMARFFRTIDLPESTFLRETIDELCAAMYELAQGVLRERKDPDVNTDNMVSTFSKESVSRAADDSRGMLDDAEDFVGEAGVGDVRFEDVRSLIERAETSREKKLDLARVLCEGVLRFETRHLAAASNLLGVIHLWQNRPDDAEQSFLRTLAAPARDQDDRVFKAFAHCNLAYLSHQKGDLQGAVRSARRSVAVSEEIGEAPYFGLFAMLYFNVLRRDEGEAAAREALAKMLTLPDGAKWLGDALRLENNRTIADALRASFVGAEHAALLPPP